MNNPLPPYRIRLLHDPSLMHQRISNLFLRHSLSPSGQTATPLSHHGFDGLYKRAEGAVRLVK